MDDGPFAEFVAARHASLVRSAFLLTGDRGHAQDVVQAALVKTFGAWQSLHGPAAAEAYTRTTMVRLIGRWGRRRWRGEVPAGSFVAGEGLGTTAPGAAALDLTVAADVRRALGRLPWDQRAVLVLRFLDDLTVEDTAAVLECSVGTVKSRTSRALATLRRSGALTGYSEVDHGH